MRINALRIMRCLDTMVMGDREVSKINCYKKCRETLKGNKIQLCAKHSTVVVTIYVPSVNKEST